MFKVEKITGLLLEGTKKMVSKGGDRFNLVDGIFALGELAKNTNDLVTTMKEKFAAIPDELNEAKNLNLAESFAAFLLENRERLVVVGAAAPGLIELLVEHLMGDESIAGDLPFMDAGQWFENLLESVLDQAMGMIGEEGFDLFEFLKHFESVADVFIQEWLLPQFDRDLGI